MLSENNMTSLGGKVLLWTILLCLIWGTTYSEAASIGLLAH